MRASSLLLLLLLLPNSGQTADISPTGVNTLEEQKRITLQQKLAEIEAERNRKLKPQPISQSWDDTTRMQLLTPASETNTKRRQRLEGLLNDSD